MEIAGIDLRGLQESAEKVCRAAYAPYSRFQVGCAVVSREGRVYSGCNVENSSYGMTMCAERNAIAAAVAAGVGKGELLALWIYTPGQRPAPPCGACRQVIQEMMHPEARVISSCGCHAAKEWTIETLLPDPFEPEDLNTGGATE